MHIIVKGFGFSTCLRLCFFQVLIIGQPKHLALIDWDLVSTKFGGTVTKDVSILCFAFFLCIV
jgi:hypothetical protein